MVKVLGDAARWPCLAQRLRTELAKDLPGFHSSVCPVYLPTESQVLHFQAAREQQLCTDHFGGSFETVCHQQI